MVAPGASVVAGHVAVPDRGSLTPMPVIVWLPVFRSAVR
jgi:hypothetical protein